jgi:hypothetical protein
MVAQVQQVKTSGNLFDELRDEVVANGNILAVKMVRLRAAAGYGRLGKYVVEDIDKKLRGRGLGHTKLSVDNQEAIVYIYVMGSDPERLVEAAQHPSDDGAEVIRTATDQNATDLLREVKALVEGV